MAKEKNDRLAKAARRHHARAEHWRRKGERPMGRNLAMIGTYGWMIAALTVGGAFLGRWLDGLRGGGIVFTAALVLLGAAAGLWIVWRRMNKE